MASSSTTTRAEAFIARAASVHNGKYDYRLVASSYRSAHEKTTIICSLHGPFQQAPASHTKGQGCPHCGGRVGASAEARRDRFIAGATARHGHRYNYDAVNFVDQRTPVEIRCQDHGPFQQRPTNHVHGSGCPSCGHAARTAARVDKLLGARISQAL
jgi:Zn finger protein HypA/HybF involved in hydrogenase expression